MCKNLNEFEKQLIVKREKIEKVQNLRTEIDKTMRFFKVEMGRRPNGAQLQLYVDSLEGVNIKVQELMKIDTDGITNYGIYEQFFNIMVRNWISERVKPLAIVTTSPPVVTPPAENRLENSAAAACLPGTKWSQCQGRSLK